MTNTEPTLNKPMYNKEHMCKTCAESLYKEDKYMKFLSHCILFNIKYGQGILC
jgi:hypothetical protein